MDFHTVLAPISVAFVTALGLGIYPHLVEDRVPLLNRIIDVTGVALFALFAVWAGIEAPKLLLIGIGAFVLLNLADALVSTSSRLDASPAPPRVWVEPLNDLSRLGWAHLGTWSLDLGGKKPELTIYERPHDGTRVIAIGTAASGGIAEVLSLLDGGRGYLSTLNKRSRTIRPPWLFKQALVGDPFNDLVRAHDEALQYLRVMGVTPSPFPAGDPTEAMRAEHRRMRRFVTRRWWLAAIRPLVIWLTPSRMRRLHEQSDIARQLARYRESVSRESTGPSPATL